MPILKKILSCRSPNICSSNFDVIDLTFRIIGSYDGLIFSKLMQHYLKILNDIGPVEAFSLSKGHNIGNYANWWLITPKEIRASYYLFSRVEFYSKHLAVLTSRSSLMEYAVGDATNWQTCKWHRVCEETGEPARLLPSRIWLGIRQIFWHAGSGTWDHLRSRTPSRRRGGPWSEKDERFEISFWSIIGRYRTVRPDG